MHHLGQPTGREGRSFPLRLSRDLTSVSLLHGRGDFRRSLLTKITVPVLFPTPLSVNDGNGLKREAGRLRWLPERAGPSREDRIQHFAGIRRLKCSESEIVGPMGMFRRLTPVRGNGRTARPGHEVMRRTRCGCRYRIHVGKTESAGPCPAMETSLRLGICQS
jgi:hypothetical protein